MDFEEKKVNSNKKEHKERSKSEFRRECRSNCLFEASIQQTYYFNSDSKLQTG